MGALNRSAIVTVVERRSRFLLLGELPDVHDAQSVYDRCSYRPREAVARKLGKQREPATTNSKGLRIRAELDQSSYPSGIKISDKQLVAVTLHPHDWHGNWNYTII